jgi:hypothetical protein
MPSVIENDALESGFRVYHCPLSSRPPLMKACRLRRRDGKPRAGRRDRSQELAKFRESQAGAYSPDHAAEPQAAFFRAACSLTRNTCAVDGARRATERGECSRLPRPPRIWRKLERTLICGRDREPGKLHPAGGWHGSTESRTHGRRGLRVRLGACGIRAREHGHQPQLRDRARRASGRGSARGGRDRDHRLGRDARADQLRIRRLLGGGAGSAQPGLERFGHAGRHRSDPIDDCRHRLPRGFQTVG